MRAAATAIAVVLAALAAVATPERADAKRFKVRAPREGEVVLVQIRGTARSRKPVRLRLLNPRAFRSTIIAAGTWRARRGKAFDGVIVLHRPKGSALDQPLAGPNALFNGALMISVQVQIAYVGLLVQMLFPAVQRARELARRTACGDSFRSVGTQVQFEYMKAKALGQPPRDLVRNVCAAATDDTIPGAAEFWNVLGHPYCGFSNGPFGTGNTEIRLFGMCNRQVRLFGITPPSPLQATACLPFAGSVCDAQPGGVSFFFPGPPAQPFVPLSGNIRVNNDVVNRQGWMGLYRLLDDTSSLFPIDANPNEFSFPY